MQNELIETPQGQPQELLEKQLHMRLGASAAGAAEAIAGCVHCGFCLSTCPTYAETADETESPRGRIVLMKAALEDEVALESVLPHIDGCLGCLACETSCPSGVKYGALLEPFREYAEKERDPDPGRVRMRRMLLASLESPRRLLWLARLGWLGRPLARLLPESLQAPLNLLPKGWPRWGKLPETTPPLGKRRARVLLFPSCVQQVFEADVHAATLEVLAHCGVEVVTPEATRCCGALAAHVGELDRARELARHNVSVLDGADFDAILTNVAGCGSGIAEYPRWLAGCPEEKAAREVSGQAMDVADFLDQLGIPKAAELRDPITVAVQDACHLRHAQGVVGAPRRLLRHIPGLNLVEVPEAEMCCGSAGLFNVEQPDMAARLGRRKARKLAETGAELVVSGNIGCILQLGKHLENHIASEQALRADSGDPTENAHSDPLLRLEMVSALEKEGYGGTKTDVLPAIPVRHTMQVLRDAYRGVLG